MNDLASTHASQASFLKLGPQNTGTWSKILSDTYDKGVAMD